MDKPTICPYCGYRIVLTSNKELYGREFGNGKCYLCRRCRASVGTHNGKGNRPLGVLATKEMKQLKMQCHKKFDRVWKSKRLSRSGCYARLSKKLDIPVSQCHFGYFDLAMLNKALAILENPNWYKDERIVNLSDKKEEKEVINLKESLTEKLDLKEENIQIVSVDVETRKQYRDILDIN